MEHPSPAESVNAEARKQAVDAKEANPPNTNHRPENLLVVGAVANKLLSLCWIPISLFQSAVLFKSVF